MQPQHVPQEFLFELAFGLEEPADVALRYGIEPEDYAVLCHQPWFIRAWKAKKSELNLNGSNFRSKMAIFAEDLLTDTYRYGKACESLTVKLEIAKYLTRVADLEPKANQVPINGSGFSISINFSGDRKSDSPGNDNESNIVADIPHRPRSFHDDLPSPPAYLSLIPYESLDSV